MRISEIKSLTDNEKVRKVLKGFWDSGYRVVMASQQFDSIDDLFAALRDEVLKSAATGIFIKDRREMQTLSECLYGDPNAWLYGTDAGRLVLERREAAQQRRVDRKERQEQLHFLYKRLKLSKNYKHNDVVAGISYSEGLVQMILDAEERGEIRCIDDLLPLIRDYYDVAEDREKDRLIWISNTLERIRNNAKVSKMEKEDSALS